MVAQLIFLSWKKQGPDSCSALNKAALQGWEVWCASWQRFMHVSVQTTLAPLSLMAQQLAAEPPWLISSLFLQCWDSTRELHQGSGLDPFYFCTHFVPILWMLCRCYELICSHFYRMLLLTYFNRVQMVCKNPFRLSRTLCFRSLFFLNV